MFCRSAIMCSCKYLCIYILEHMFDRILRNSACLLIKTICIFWSVVRFYMPRFLISVLGFAWINWLRVEKRINGNIFSQLKLRHVDVYHGYHLLHMDSLTFLELADIEVLLILSSPVCVRVYILIYGSPCRLCAFRSGKLIMHAWCSRRVKRAVRWLGTFSVVCVIAGRCCVRGSPRACRRLVDIHGTWASRTKASFAPRQ